MLRLLDDSDFRFLSAQPGFTTEMAARVRAQRYRLFLAYLKPPKHGRVRTVPMPTWVKVAIDAWTAPAGVVDGHVFRPVIRADHVQGEVLPEKIVWQMLRPYATVAGVPGRGMRRRSR